mgnify:CR=1 FL=1
MAVFFCRNHLQILVQIGRIVVFQKLRKNVISPHYQAMGFSYFQHNALNK